MVMVYLNMTEAEKMPVVMDAVLQKYFPEKTWGAIPLINERGEVELVTIDRVQYTGGGRHGEETEWTHYANIQLYDGDVWEVNTQFNGEKENEMWIFKYFTRLGDACRFVLKGKFKEIKPIKIY